MLKKFLPFLLAICMALPALAGAEAEPTVVRVACGTGQYEMWYRELEAKCEAETGLDIEFVEVSGGLEAVMMEHLSGGASNIDVWNIDGPNIPEMKNAAHHSDGGAFGTPGRSRTCGLQSRSLTLYPTELRAHAKDIIACQFTFVKGGGGM